MPTRPQPYENSILNKWTIIIITWRFPMLRETKIDRVAIWPLHSLSLLLRREREFVAAMIHAPLLVLS